METRGHPQSIPMFWPLFSKTTVNVVCLQLVLRSSVKQYDNCTCVPWTPQSTHTEGHSVPEKPQACASPVRHGLRFILGRPGFPARCAQWPHVFCLVFRSVFRSRPSCTDHRTRGPWPPSRRWTFCPSELASPLHCFLWYSDLRGSWFCKVLGNFPWKVFY